MVQTAACGSTISIQCVTRYIRMNFTLALPLVLCVCAGFNPAWAQASAAPTQQGSAASEVQEPTQQPANPPAAAQPSQPCAESTDTCGLEPTPQAAPAPPPAKPSEQTEKPKRAVARKKHKAHHRRVRHKKTPAQPTDGPKKTVVRNGGTSDPIATLTPGLEPAQAIHSRQTTAELLSSADANLKRACSRTLNASQQATADQVKLFMTQANAAIKAGDLDRGHNLAVKAHLLSDDLVKH